MNPRMRAQHMNRRIGMRRFLVVGAMVLAGYGVSLGAFSSSPAMAMPSGCVERTIPPDVKNVGLVYESSTKQLTVTATVYSGSTNFRGTGGGYDGGDVIESCDPGWMHGFGYTKVVVPFSSACKSAAGCAGTLDVAERTLTLVTTLDEIVPSTGGSGVVLVEVQDGETGATASSTAALDVSPVVACGDGVRSGSEVCEGANLGGNSCATLGFTNGTLSCIGAGSPGECTFNTLSCWNTIPPFCGDGTINLAEQCDGGVGGQSCASIGMGYDGGTLSCTSTCGYNTDNCWTTTPPDPECGDGFINVGVGEECDGSNVNGLVCADLGMGYEGGIPTCSSACTLLTDDCTSDPIPPQSVCGNNIVEAGEVCDGNNVNTYVCDAFGYTGGSLGCLPGCMGYDISGCNFSSHPDCGDGFIDQGEACDGTVITLGCEDFGYGVGPSVCTPSCRLDISLCVDPSPAPSCGDNIVNQPSEVCDGEPVAQSCVGLDIGFSGGTLGCDTNCAFDTSSCTTPPDEEYCGDNILQTWNGESCDTNRMGGATCTNIGLGYIGGSISCNDECSYNTTNCISAPPQLCGNGDIDASNGETCDGTNMGGRTCQTEGFVGGTLSCRAFPTSNYCTVDTGSCITSICGDGVVTGEEACDGSAWGGIVKACPVGSYQISLTCDMTGIDRCKTYTQTCQEYPWVISSCTIGSQNGDAEDGLQSVNRLDGLNHDPLSPNLTLKSVMYIQPMTGFTDGPIEPVLSPNPPGSNPPAYWYLEDQTSWYGPPGFTAANVVDGDNRMVSFKQNTDHASGMYEFRAEVMDGMEIATCHSDVEVAENPSGSVSPHYQTGYLNSGTVGLSFSDVSPAAGDVQRAVSIRVVDTADEGDYLSWPTYPNGIPSPSEGARWNFYNDGIYGADDSNWDPDHVVSISSGGVTLKPAPGLEQTVHTQHLELAVGSSASERTDCGQPGSQCRWTWTGRGTAPGDETSYFSMIRWVWAGPTCTATSGGAAQLSADIGQTIALHGGASSAGGSFTTPGLGYGSWQIVSGPAGGSLGAMTTGTSGSENYTNTSFTVGDSNGVNDSYILRYTNGDAGGGCTSDVRVYVKDYALRIDPAKSGFLSINPTSYSYTVYADYFNGFGGQVRFSPPITLTGTPAAIFDSDPTPADIDACASGALGGTCIATSTVTFNVPNTQPPSMPYQLPGVYTFEVPGSALNGLGNAVLRTTSSGLTLSCQNDPTGIPQAPNIKNKDYYNTWTQDGSPDFWFDHVWDTGAATSPLQCLQPSSYSWKLYRTWPTASGTPISSGLLAGPTQGDVYPAVQEKQLALPTTVANGAYEVLIQAVDINNLYSADVAQSRVKFFVDSVNPTVNSFAITSCPAGSCKVGSAANIYFFRSMSPLLTSLVTDEKPSNLAGNPGNAAVPTAWALGRDCPFGAACPTRVNPSNTGLFATFLTEILPASAPFGSGGAALVTMPLYVPANNTNTSASTTNTGGWDATVTRSSSSGNGSLALSRDEQTWSISPHTAGTCPATPAITSRLTPWDQAHNGGNALTTSATLVNDELEPSVTSVARSNAPTETGLIPSPATVEHDWHQDTAVGVAPTITLSVLDEGCPGTVKAGTSSLSATWTPGPNVISISDVVGGNPISQRAGPAGLEVAPLVGGPVNVPYLENTLTVTTNDMVGNSNIETTTFRRCLEDLQAPDTPVLTAPAQTTWKNATARLTTLTVTNPKDNGTSANEFGTYPGGIVPEKCTNTLKRYKLITIRNPITGPKAVPGKPAANDMSWTDATPPGTPVGQPDATGSVTIPAPAGGWTDGWYSVYAVVTDTSLTQENVSDVSNSIDILVDNTAPVVDPMVITNCGTASCLTSGTASYFTSSGGFTPILRSTERDGFPVNPAAILPGAFDPNAHVNLSINTLAAPLALVNDTILGPITGSGNGWDTTVSRTTHNRVTATEQQTWTIANTSGATCPALSTLTMNVQAWDQANNASANTPGGISLNLDNVGPLVWTEVFNGNTRNATPPATSALPLSPATIAHPWVENPSPGVAPVFTHMIADVACTAPAAVGLKDATFTWTRGPGVAQLSEPATYSKTYSLAAGEDLSDTFAANNIPYLENTLTVTLNDKLGNTRVETTVFRRCLEDLEGPDDPVIANVVPPAWVKRAGRPTRVSVTNPPDLSQSFDPILGTYPGGIVPPACAGALRRMFLVTVRNTSPTTKAAIPAHATIADLLNAANGWVETPMPGAGVPGAQGLVSIPAPVDGQWTNAWYSVYAVYTDDSQTQENVGAVSNSAEILIDDDTNDVAARPSLQGTVTIDNCSTTGDASCYTDGTTHYFSAKPSPVLPFSPHLLSTIRDTFPGNVDTALPGGLDPVASVSLAWTSLGITQTLTNDTALSVTQLTGDGQWRLSGQRLTHDQDSSTDTEEWNIAPMGLANRCPTVQTHTLTVSPQDQAGNVGPAAAGGLTLAFDNLGPQSSSESYGGTTTPGPLPASPVEHPWTQTFPLETTIDVSDQICSGVNSAGVRRIDYSWAGSANVPAPGFTEFNGPSAGIRTVTYASIPVPSLVNTLTLVSRDTVGNTRTEESIYKQCYRDTEAPDVPTIIDSAAYARWTKNRQVDFAWQNVEDNAPATGDNGPYPGGIVPDACKNDLAQYLILLRYNPSAPFQKIATAPADNDPGWTPWTPGNLTTGATVTYTTPNVAPASNDGWHAICIRAVDDAPTGVNTSAASNCIDYYIDTTTPVVQSLILDCPTCVQNGTVAGNVTGDPTVAGQVAAATIPKYFLRDTVSATIRSTVRDDKPRGFNSPAVAETIVLTNPTSGTQQNITREHVASDNPQVATYATDAGSTWNVTPTQGTHDDGQPAGVPTGPSYARATWLVGRQIGLPACSDIVTRIGLTAQDQATNAGGPLAVTGDPAIQIHVDGAGPGDNAVAGQVTETYGALPPTSPLPDEHAWSRVSATSIAVHDSACDPASDGVGTVLARVTFLSGDHLGDATDPPNPETDPMWVTTWSGPPTVNATIPVTLPDRINTMFLYLKDGVGNTRILRSLYRVDLDEPNPCTLNFTIDDVSHTATIDVMGVDAWSPTDPGSGIERFDIFRTLGPAGTTSQTVPVMTLSDTSTPAIVRTTAGGIETATGHWLDTTLTDTTEPIAPTILDGDGSPTHAASTWSRQTEFRLRWQVNGSIGTEYNYGVRCVDRVNNPATLQPAPTTVRYHSPEVSYTLTLHSDNPLSGGTPKFTPISTITDSYYRNGAANAISTDTIAAVLDPGSDFTFVANVEDASGTCPRLTRNPLGYCLPSGTYFIDIQSYAGNTAGAPPTSAASPRTSVGTFFLDVTDPTYDPKPYLYPASPNATPGPYGTPDPTTSAAQYQSALFFWNGEPTSSNPPQLTATIQALDADSGVSRLQPWAVNRTGNPIDLGRTAKPAVATGTILILPVAGVQPTVVTSIQTLALPPNGNDAPVFGDHYTITSTAHDSVVEPPQNSFDSPASATIIYDDRAPDMSCLFVRVGAQQVDFAQVELPPAPMEVDVNSATIDIIVDVRDTVADLRPGLDTLRRVTLRGDALVPTATPHQYLYSGLTLSTFRRNAGDAANNFLDFKGIDYAGNERTLQCKVNYFDEVHVDVQQSANQSGSLTRKQYENAGEAAMDRVTFATTLSVPGVVGMLATFYNDIDFDPSHAVGSEIARDMAFTLPDAMNTTGAHSSLALKAGSVTLPQYAIRFEGRVTPPSDGEVQLAFYVGGDDTGTLTLDPQTGIAPRTWTNNAGFTPLTASIAATATPTSVPPCIDIASASSGSPQLIQETAVVTMQEGSWYGLTLDYIARWPDANNSDTVGLLWKLPGDSCFRPIPKANLIFQANGISKFVEPYTVAGKLPPGFLLDRIQTAGGYIPDVRIRPADNGTAESPTIGLPDVPASIQTTFDSHVLNDVTSYSWSMPKNSTCFGQVGCDLAVDNNFSTRVPVGGSVTILVNAHAAKAYFLPTGSVNP